jgi:hypothetical protein
MHLSERAPFEHSYKNYERLTTVPGLRLIS